MNFVEKIRKNRYNLILFILVVVDYLLTYVGINFFGVIEEANPAMVWIFDVPFEYAFPFRVFYAFVIFVLCYYIVSKDFKYYKQFIGILLFIQGVIFAMHFYWIFKFSLMMIF